MTFDYNHIFKEQIKKKVDHYLNEKEDRQIGGAWLEIRMNMYKDVIMMKCWNIINSDHKTTKTLKRKIEVFEGKKDRLEHMETSINSFFKDIQDRFTKKEGQ
tara:strand:+ start:6448 stop:6753 length:306 start_codon:yes stop_codon:yes gene_type:complete